MQKLCLFALRTLVFAALGVLLPGASPERHMEPRCAAFGYYDGNDKLVNTPLLTAPLVDGTRISGEYGPRPHPILKRVLMHSGLDIAAAIGTPVYAVADGVIVEATHNDVSGLYVRIHHDAIYETAFAHLSAFGEGVRPGAYVHKGQVVAFVGSTGRSTAAHLHVVFWVRHSRVRPACRCGVTP